MPEETDRAEFAVDVEVQGVISSLDVLADPGSRELLYGALGPPGDPGLANILDRLQDNFKHISTQYMKLAKRAIQSDPPENKDYEFAKARDKLVDHALLLSSIREAWALGLLERWPLIGRIIDAISTRFEPRPILIPVVADQFEYVHFNYKENVAVIRIPLHIWSTPSRSLSLLWHEVAGYAVARARRNGDLKRCADALQGDLAGIPNNQGTLDHYYRDRFMQSALENVTARVNLNQERATIRQPKAFHDLLVREIGGIDWRLDWLGEFVEDLFFAQAFGAMTLDLLALALMQSYEKATLGDPEHPASDFRIQVVLEYLYLLNSGNQSAIAKIQATAQSVQNSFPGLSHIDIDPGGGAGGALKRTAKRIAEMYRRRITDFSSEKIDAKEKALVDEIKGILESPQEGQKDFIPTKLQQLGAGGVTLFPEDMPLPERSDYIWSSVGLDPNDLDNATIDRRTLREIELVETDQKGPGGGAFPRRFG